MREPPHAREISGLGRRIRRDVEVDDHAAVMAEYDEAEQDAKRRCRHREEVDGNDVTCVVVQESLPRLRRWRTMADPVLVDSRFGHIVPEQCEFRLDPRR